MKHIYLLISLIVYSKSFSQILIDDFTNHDLMPARLNTNFANLGMNLDRQVTLPHGYFPNKKKGPLHCRFPSDVNNIEETFLFYLFGSSLDVSSPEKSILRITLSNISAPFQLGVSVSDSVDLINYKNINEKEKNISCNPGNSIYEIDINTMPQIDGNSDFNMKAVRSLTFIINDPDQGIPDLAVDLNSIELVPEPFSLWILGSGVTVLVRKKYSIKGEDILKSIKT